MVNIPGEALAELFGRFLERGAVLRVEKYSGLVTGTRDKYLVLLNISFSESQGVHHVLTTSQVDKIRQFSWSKDLVIIIPSGTLGFFPKETAINCREVRSLGYATLKARYVDGTLRFVGKLPDAVIERIDVALRRSPHLPPRVAREILPP